MNATKTLKNSKKMITTIRFDHRLREQAQSFAESHGIDFSTLVTLSLKTTLQNGIHLNPQISDERYTAYEQLIKDVESGKEKVKSYPDFQSLKKDLLKS